MRQAGAKTIGQDESTCVVYGMPKVAYDLGAVQYQEKLSDIASRTYSILNKM
jgi:two-component system chemotaxis response regulator CheB